MSLWSNDVRIGYMNYPSIRNIRMAVWKPPSLFLTNQHATERSPKYPPRRSPFVDQPSKPV